MVSVVVGQEALKAASKPFSNRRKAGSGWELIGASALAFDESYLTPRPLDAAAISDIC